MATRVGGYGGPCRGPPLEQKIPLRHGQYARRLAREHHTVSAHLIGLGIDLDPRQRVVVDHVALADVPAFAHRHGPPCQTEALRHALRQRGRRHERERCRPEGPAERAEHGPVEDGLGVGIDAFGSPIAAQAMRPPLTTSSGLTPKNAGFQSTRSASLPASTDPTCWARPCAMAGLIVYFAT